MVKIIENLDIKVASLEESISYPPYKETEGLKTIEVDSFNYDLIKEKLVSAENIDGEKLILIEEIIKLLDGHKLKFSIDNHNYIGLYWRGLPMLIIKTKSINTQTMMYVAVKSYKDELEKRSNSKLGSRIMMGVAAIGGLFVSYKLWSSNSDVNN